MKKNHDNEDIRIRLTKTSETHCLVFINGEPPMDFTRIPSGVTLLYNDELKEIAEIEEQRKAAKRTDSGEGDVLQLR